MLEDIYASHADAVDSIITEFTAALDKMVERASSKLGDNLNNQLKLAGDFVAMSAKNQKMLAGIDERFQALLEEEGYQELLSNYVDSFNGQFEWFNKVLASLSEELPYPLPQVSFTKGEMALFDLQRVSSKELIQGAVDKAGARARQQALQAIGGVTPKQLSVQIADTLGNSVAEAESLADTSISTFYRTITDKGFQIIEDDLPLFKIRYTYSGPMDKLNRPFCLKLERLARAGKTWTREEIGKMNNGQIPNVRVTCGGYRCRHQWAIAVSDLQAQQKKQGTQKVNNQRKVTRDTVAEELSARKALMAMKMQNRLGVPHPHEQIKAIRAKAEATVASRRARV